MKTYRQDINEKIAYGFDWFSRLDRGDYIIQSDWTIDNGLTSESATYDSADTEITLSGGAEDTQYRVSNTVTSAAGKIYERSFMLMVVDR